MILSSSPLRHHPKWSIQRVRAKVRARVSIEKEKEMGAVRKRRKTLWGWRRHVTSATILNIRNSLMIYCSKAGLKSHQNFQKSLSHPVGSSNLWSNTPHLPRDRFYPIKASSSNATGGMPPYLTLSLHEDSIYSSTAHMWVSTRQARAPTSKNRYKNVSMKFETVASNNRNRDS